MSFGRMLLSARPDGLSGWADQGGIAENLQ